MQKIPSENYIIKLHAKHFTAPHLTLDFGSIEKLPGTESSERESQQERGRISAKQISRKRFNKQH